MSGEEQKLIADVKDDIEAQMKKEMETYFEGKEYTPDEAQAWAEEVCSNIIKNLKEEGLKGYKYSLTSTIFPKDACSVHTAGNCLWDPTTDECIRVKHEAETFYCILVLFATKV